MKRLFQLFAVMAISMMFACGSSAPANDDATTKAATECTKACQHKAKCDSTTACGGGCEDCKCDKGECKKGECGKCECGKSECSKGDCSKGGCNGEKSEKCSGCKADK